MTAFFRDLISRVSSPGKAEEPSSANESSGASASPHLLADSLNAAETFRRFNRERLARLERQVGERAYQALRALPVLLHTNFEELPGHHPDPACPYGITSFEPRSDDLELLRKLFPRSNPRRAPVPRMAVDLVAVMGSAGSIGFAEGSDLDIWICFRLTEHSANAMELYREKVADIEAWMNRYSGVEIHLFVQPVEHIRDNRFGEADLEGCGSALGMLLKEEFYRTAIQLAGRPPLWVAVPAEADSKAYAAHRAALEALPGYDAHEFVDLGGVDTVSVGELFGAAIWQIAKGQKSPFKSALKMAYLEKTVCSGVPQPPLCEIFKREVLAHHRPDPYRLLFDVVLEYYSGHNDLPSQELLSECFYLKTGLKLDPAALDVVQAGEDAEALRRYVQSWRWGRRKVERLNNFSGWRFEWIKELSADLNRFFLRSYKRIYEEMERSGGRHTITERDLTFIGRKLLVAYRQVPNKLDHIHILGRGAHEPILSLIEAPLENGQTEWRLYRGHVNALNEEERLQDLIRSFHDVLELMVWAAYNGILGQKSRLLCRPLAQQFSSADLESIAPLLAAFLSAGEERVHTPQDLLNDPLPFQMAVFANLGRTEKDIVELGVVYQTTWGETFFRSFSGNGAFREFAEQLLFPFWSHASDPRRTEVFATRSKISAQSNPGVRLKRWLQRLAAFFLDKPLAPRERRRFLLSTAEGVAFLERTDSGFGFQSFPSLQQFQRRIEAIAPDDLVQTLVDSDSPLIARLGAMFEASEPGKVDIFVAEDERPNTIYVIDEIGNLHRQECEPGDPVYTLSKLLLFVENATAAAREHPMNPLASSAPLRELVRIHKFIHDPVLRAYPATHDYLARIGALGLNPVGLAIERTPSPEPGKPGGYVIRWGSEVIRSGEVANPLEELKRRIGARRQSGADYSVFVTELFLDAQYAKTHCGSFPAVGHYLVYKRALEQRLNS